MKQTIALVDDDRNILTSVSMTLEQEGFQVRTYTDGESALQGITARPVDLAVLDVKMPRMDGIETLKEIKKRHPRVEVIMLTGHGSVESGVQGMSHGAYDYVLKPFQLDELLHKIRLAFERKQLHERNHG